MNALINIGMYLAYIAMGVAIILLVYFALKSIFTSGSSSKSTLIGVGILIAIVIISYLLSSGNVSEIAEKYNTSPQQVKLISAGLLTTYITGGVLVILTVYTAVSKWFK